VLPRLGALRPDLGAASLAFASGLTVWDRIRQHAATGADAAQVGRRGWRRLLVAGMAAVITAWNHSGREIVAGMVTPSNVIVPDRDWQRDRLVISLAGWRPYTGPLDLARPLLQNFLRLPPSHYPALRGLVDDGWLAEAVAEALGAVEARQFLVALADALKQDPRPQDGDELASRMRLFADELAVRYRPTLTVEGACERFERWRSLNPDASSHARSDQIESLIRLYRLDLEGELACFTLFREAYLREADTAALHACDQLLARLFRFPDLRAARTVEMSDLQAALTDPEDREALSRLAFPRSALGHRPALQAIGDRARGHVVLQTEIADDRGTRHMVREPRDAAEMGRLYRLFLQSGFPLDISENDRHLVLVDRDGQLSGGVVWRLDAIGEPHLDGVVVARPMRGRGLARLLLEDFARRLSDDGHQVLRTHFSLQGFFTRLGFHTDRQRGGLVRRLA
jgi:GNAT superfamily N-acetyltransferase